MLCVTYDNKKINSWSKDISRKRYSKQVLKAKKITKCIYNAKNGFKLAV